MVVFTKLLITTFVVPQAAHVDHLSLSSSKTRSGSSGTSTETNENQLEGSLSDLCTLFNAEPGDLLSLKPNKMGIRGVHLNQDVEEGQAILKVPLESCLRDDSPPDWLETSEPDNEEGEENTYSVSMGDWVTRLTATLLEVQRQEDKSKGMKAWINLLPTNLRELLPIHWDSSIIETAQSRALELAVDSAFFARSGPIGDLMASSKEAGLGFTQRQVEDAMDLVQTRSCRAQAEDGTPYMRVLVPIFDLINHDRENNAEFFREGEFMIVRAKQDIPKETEVLISYGASTSPHWKCLFSYGFVPITEDVYEDDAAEIVVDGVRFEVGPTEIPFELVQHEAEKLGLTKEGEEVEFTPEIGKNIVDRLKSSAKELETAKSDLNDGSIARYLVEDLIKSHRRTIQACAGGLMEFIDG